jgi:hypothetical protein
MPALPLLTLLVKLHALLIDNQTTGPRLGRSAAFTAAPQQQRPSCPTGQLRLLTPQRLLLLNRHNGNLRNRGS